MPNWCNNYLTIECDIQTTKEIEGKLEYAVKYSGASGHLKREYELNMANITSPEDIERITTEYNVKLKKLENSGLADGNVYVFRTLVGLPNNITKSEYDKNWYDANVNGYGTKWDVDYCDHNWDFYDEGGMSVSFETAWSPPEGFCHMLMKKYKGITLLELQYEEPGCDFAGKYTFTRDVAGDEEYNFSDECYGYLEGLYRLDLIDCFWSEAENRLDNDYESVDEYMNNFDFLNTNDNEDIKIINELKTMYEEHFQDAN